MGIYTEFYSENLKGRDLLGNLDGDVRIIKWILKKYGAKFSTGFSRFRIGPSSVLLWKW
jgi:hypothetical protein